VCREHTGTINSVSRRLARGLRRCVGRQRGARTQQPTCIGHTYFTLPAARGVGGQVQQCEVVAHCSLTPFSSRLARRAAQLPHQAAINPHLPWSGRSPAAPPAARAESQTPARPAQRCCGCGGANTQHRVGRGAARQHNSCHRRLRRQTQNTRAAAQQTNCRGGRQRPGRSTLTLGR
jgi:hypothetical protein